MTFLSPIAGLIAAAVTIPLLALLYFLKLRRRPVRVSSNMLWESAVRDLQVNAPFKMLRFSWLLILQLLALALLLIAFARPAIDGGPPASAGLIIVIDNSASMSAPAGDDAAGPTRLEEAKSQAIELLDRLSRRTAIRIRPSVFDDEPHGGSAGAGEAMIITFAHDARIVTNFTSDRTALRRAIEGIEPTDQPADFEALLRLVEAQILRAGDEHIAQERVVLFSDGALRRTQRGRMLGVGGADFRFIRIGPDPDAPRDNIGIVAMSARRDYEDPGVVRLFARLQNAGADPVEASVRLTLDGEPIGVRTIRVPGASNEAPGEAPATFELRTMSGGLAALSIRRTDMLASDNEAALLITPPTAPRILLVRPDLRTEADSLADGLLRRALEEIAGAEPDVVNGDGYERLAGQRDGLAPYDMVIFDRVRPGAPPPLPTLSFGATIPGTGLGLVDPHQDDPEAARGSSRFLSWRRTNPLLRNVGLDPVVISRSRIITLPGETGDPGPDADGDTPGRRGIVATPLAIGPDGPLLASIEDGSLTRVVVAFPLARSTWALQPSFVIFMSNVVERLTTPGDGGAGRGFTTTEAAPVAAASGVDRVRVTGPISFEARVTADADDRLRAVVGPIPRAGVYLVEGAAAGDRILPVNLVSPHESAIATSDTVEVAGRSARSASLGDAAPREIWHWFVMVAFALLMIEWLFFAMRTKV
ncbi:MAG: VWA domain-containing protein [Phycisphaeraceae bacterium]|nr:MAG: VWA domain-containing protein [Phycisphaeraceae bacterium]